MVPNDIKLNNAQGFELYVVYLDGDIDLSGEPSFKQASHDVPKVQNKKAKEEEE